MVEDPDQRKRTVSSIHDTSHMGLNRTTDMVSGKYYWPGLTADVKAYVSSLILYALHCVTFYCHFVIGSQFLVLNNKKLQKSAGGLHPIVIQPKIWCQVGMDLIGPMPKVPRGNKYIVTLTDYSSKWAEPAPLKDKSVVGVAKFIYSVSSYLLLIDA